MPDCALETDLLELRRGTEADIPFVMATERLLGYDELVGRWDDAQHGAALADARYVYFVAHLAAAPVGFAIVRDWASPERVTYIKRIAISRPGFGVGRALLRKVLERIFRETEAHRVWLGVFPENVRARRTYSAVGFQTEGISRGSAFFGGLHRDEVVMSLLRPEWSARRPGGDD
jgi:diamine N-acetyltransferase